MVWITVKEELVQLESFAMGGGMEWGAGASPPAALLTLTIRAHNQAHMIKNRSRCVLVTHLISWVFINHNTNHDGNASLQLCRLSCSVWPTHCFSGFLFKFDLESCYKVTW